MFGVRVGFNEEVFGVGMLWGWLYDLVVRKHSYFFVVSIGFLAHVDRGLNC